MKPTVRVGRCKLSIWPRGPSSPKKERPDSHYLLDKSSGLGSVQLFLELSNFFLVSS